MKKKEREHLKEDPFEKFIIKSISFLKQYKTIFISGIIAVLLVVIIIIVIGFLRSSSISSKNDIYAQALKIKNSTTMDQTEKIEKLKALENNGGISSASQLLLATIYYESGDMKSAKEVLDQFPDSRMKLINDQKKLLTAEVLLGLEQPKESIKLLYELFSDPEGEIARDFLLLKMAKVKQKMEQTKAAITDLNQLISDFPYSRYSYEAQSILKKLEEKEGK